MRYIDYRKKLMLIYALAKRNDFEYIASSQSVEIIKYLGNCTNVIIPKRFENIQVQSLSNKAFAYRTDIKSVTLPNGITKIG